MPPTIKAKEDLMVDYTWLYMHGVMTVIKTTDRTTERCQPAVNVRAFPN